MSEYAINNTAEAIKDFAGTGLSILEISHRSKEFSAVIEEAANMVKELLEVPEGYHVLFLGGGASLQFCMVPYNLLKTKAAYLDTGTWANKAIKEARLFGEVDVVASSKDANYTFIPKDYTIPADADYFHITTNNTIYGTELRRELDSPVPMVADMSSDIFSRPIDVSKYDVIYAGAQKNLAPAGVTLVIAKESAMGHVDRAIPTMLDYRTHISKGSMFNTPPVLPIYTALQTLKWYKEMGGVKIMNVCFVMKPEYKELEKDFIDFASTKGIVGIKGHRSVGGFRASLYNAMPMSSVQVLIDAMKEFESNH